MESGQLSKETVQSKADNIAKRLYHTPGPTISVVSCAASFCFHGYFTKLDNMTLKEVDVSSIPPDHLSALSSSITQTLYIDNMEGDITPVLLNHNGAAASFFAGTSEFDSVCT